MKYVYLIESLPPKDRNLSGSKILYQCTCNDWWPSSGIKIIQPNKNVKTSIEFVQEVNAFLDWMKETDIAENDQIILWFAVHGSDEVHIGEFADENDLCSLDYLGLLSRNLPKNTILILHSCWGGLADITRVMNHSDFGPKYIFAPRIDAFNSTLRHAEKIFMNYLLNTPDHDIGKLIEMVTDINKWGKDHQLYHYKENYYRVWYWGDKDEFDIKQFPRCGDK